MIRSIILATTLLWVLAVFGPADATGSGDTLPAFAQSITQAKVTDNAVGNCVRTNRIRRTRILDDQTILLEMAGGTDLAMHLKYRCPQLKFHDFFSYEPTLGQLCAELDHIVTRAGFHCDIGGFSLYRPDDSTES